MDLSDVMAHVAAGLGGAANRWRRLRGSVHQQAVGASPVIPAARPQGSIPTLKMPTARGWAPGQVPAAAPGLAVNAFAAGLKHPRCIHVLPNGDVAVAEAIQSAGTPRSVFDHAMIGTMRRAAAVGESPNRITLLRDADGDGTAEVRETFLADLNQPFGMALVGDTFYVGNTDGVFAFAYMRGATRIDAKSGKRLATFPPGGHWTRSLLASTDGRRLYCGVGSLSNIADHGFDIEAGRACIVEIDLTTGARRTFASGLRNPVGMAWQPHTGALWTVVNERDGLGDETPPDYLTSVLDGGFYGWPYCWWGKTVDERVQPQDVHAVSRALTPTTRSAATPHRWACAGCRPARCRASARAWRSASTGRGTEARCRATRSSSCHSTVASPPDHLARSSAASSRPTNASRTAGRWVWRWHRAVGCWWPTTWVMSCGG